ncbi:hypothetical protein SDC9_189445 [bioreactor metagenome]|uniref:Uncharacterized protein n=1 Tax=bioreactor metagenome TaxID=1076179 RepID=A0A645HSR5_9ZZZZ
MTYRRHIQRLVVALQILAGQTAAGFGHLLNGFQNPGAIPYFVLADFIVIQPAGGDRLAPGAEKTLGRGIDTRIIRRVIIRVQRFLPEPG